MFEGSSVALALGAARIVVTAKHVVSSAQSKVVSLGSAGAREWPATYRVLESLDPSDPDPDIAIAVAEVDEVTDAALPALPLTDLAPHGEYSAGDSVIVVGFPASKAKDLHSQNALRAKLLTATGDLVDNRMYGLLGRPMANHLLISYVRDSCLDEDGATVVGAHPRGMSGGAVFIATCGELPDGSIVGMPKLIGILTGYRESDNLLVATRIECLLDAMNIRPHGLSPRFRAVAV
jgi:hypothetical protein